MCCVAYVAPACSEQLLTSLVSRTVLPYLGDPGQEYELCHWAKRVWKKCRLGKMCAMHHVPCALRHRFSAMDKPRLPDAHSWSCVCICVHVCCYACGASLCLIICFLSQAALTVGLGGKSGNTGRGSKLEDLIMHGKNSAVIRIRLLNDGKPCQMCAVRLCNIALCVA